MSHAVEDLIERSVLLLDKQALDARLLRDSMVNLFRFQGRFDCGDTRGRVQELLLRRRALLCRPLLSHPDAERFAALFARLSRSDGWLTPDVTKDGVAGMSTRVDRVVLWASDALTVGDRPEGTRADFGNGVYVRDATLQIDVGSGIWQRLVERGDFSGMDAEAPERLQPHRVAAIVVEAAAEAGDRTLMAHRYATLPWFVLAVGEPEDIASLCTDTDVTRMLELMAQTRAYEERSDWGLLRPPREEELSDQGEAFLAFARKWYALEWSLPAQRDWATVIVEVVGRLRSALEGGDRPGPALTRAVKELAEFRELNHLRVLIQHGFGYSSRGMTALVESVVDFSGQQPVVDEAQANAKLSLQK